MSQPSHSHEEILDGEPVTDARRPLPERVQGGSLLARQATLPAAQAAALAATSFVAGAVAVAVAAHRPRRRLSRRARRRRGVVGEIVSSNSFLVDVHLIRRS